MRKIYSIAGIDIVIDIPYQLNIQQESVEFLRDVSADDNTENMLFFKMIPVPVLSEPENAKQIEMRKYVEGINEIKTWFYSAPDSKPYAMVRTSFLSRSIECFYLDNCIDQINYSHNIIDLIGLETLLTSHNGFILHSSFIRWENNGILFTAPCGTGKSTQADLWVKYQNAEVLNGDRTGIRKVEDKWICYGLPYAGSSGIYKNEGVPLKAIFVLKQAPENTIRRMPLTEAFMHLYNESLIHRWDNVFTRICIDTISQLVHDIPVFMLSCLPDEGAVNLAKQTIENLEESW